MRCAAAAAAAFAVTAGGCGDAPDPCATATKTCVALRVEAAAEATFAAIDQLELDLVYADRHADPATEPPGGGAVDLPVVTAITFADIPAEIDLGVVAAGKLGGNVLGTGAARAVVARGAHTELLLTLSAPAACVAGGTYCGGDRVAGSPDTLYECNGGGVPIAHGRCGYGCITDPGDDDFCAGGPEPCTEGGRYCGGNEVAGDPAVLYTCQPDGSGVVYMTCAAGCAVQPSGSDDTCR